MALKKYIQTKDVIDVIKIYFKAQIGLNRANVNSIDACIDLCNEITTLALWEQEDACRQPANMSYRDYAKETRMIENGYEIE